MADLVYQPPGIYIDEQAQPVPNLPSVVALPPSRIAIIAPSQGYQSHTETIQVGATGVVLARRGIDDSSITVRALDSTLFALTTDYTVTQTGTPAAEETTTVTRNSGGAITLDSVCYVSYRYTDSSYYEPWQSGDWDDIQERYGSAINSTTGGVGSALTLAARIAMEQGAADLVLVPAMGATSNSVTAAQLKAAMDKLLARDDVGIVVPIPIGINGTDASPADTGVVALDLRAHVEASTLVGLYRRGIIGFDIGAVRNFSTIAVAVKSQRVTVAYPNAMLWYNGLTNTTMEVGGCFLAAALAGKLVTQTVQTPLTRKSLRGFAGIPARVRSTMTVPAKNALAEDGVCVIEQLSDGRLVVRHGVTTDPTSVLTREASIIAAKDAMLRLVYSTLDRSGIIGTAAEAESPVRIKSLVEGALNQCVQSGIVISFSNLTVRRSTSDLTQMEVKYAYDPAYPLNTITMSFTISTDTGSVTNVA